MKQINELLETTNCQIVDKSLGEIECFALLDEDGDVVLYEEKRGQATPFADLRFVVATIPTPEGDYHEIRAIIM